MPSCSFPARARFRPGPANFLFVPWIFQLLETQRVPSARAKAAARRIEVKLIAALLAGDRDQGGIIGRVAGAQLQRMPYAIYWSGLRRWGIRAFSGHVEQLLRTMDARRRFARSPVRDDDGELVDGLPPAWNPYLPTSPEGFPDEPLTFDLTPDDAEFLRATGKLRSLLPAANAS